MTTIRFLLVWLLFILHLSTQCWAQGQIKIAGCNDFVGYIPLVHNICFSSGNEVQTMVADVSIGRADEEPVEVNWEGPGIIEKGFINYFNDLYPYVKFKASQDADMTIQWHKVYYDNQGLPILVCRKGLTKIRILRPQPPKIVVKNPVVGKGQTVYMHAEQSNSCVTGPCLTEWGLSSCDPSGTQISWQGNYYGSFPAFQYQVFAPMQFVARSKEPGGCDSEPNVINALVNNVATSADCNDPAIDLVNRASERVDNPAYHYYKVETKICDVSPDNPNCTQDLIYKLLTSQISNNVPIALDLPGLKTLEYKFKLPLSDLFFPLDKRPILNCFESDLPDLRNVLGDISRMVSANYPCFDPFPTFSNPVRITRDDENFCAVNYTQPGHIFFPGKITRCVVWDNCGIKIVTVGSGTNDICPRISQMNVEYGAPLFERIDQRVKEQYEALSR